MLRSHSKSTNNDSLSGNSTEAESVDVATCCCVSPPIPLNEVSYSFSYYDYLSPSDSMNLLLDGWHVVNGMVTFVIAGLAIKHLL
jgi:hypothetical protein